MTYIFNGVYYDSLIDYDKLNDITNNELYCQKLKITSYKKIDLNEIEIILGNIGLFYDIILDTLYYYDNIIIVYCNPFHKCYNINLDSRCIYFNIKDIEVNVEIKSKVDIIQYHNYGEYIEFEILSNYFKTYDQFETFIYNWTDNNKFDIKKWINTRYKVNKLEIIYENY